jgi:hypothetical protein
VENTVCQEAVRIHFSELLQNLSDTGLPGKGNDDFSSDRRFQSNSDDAFTQTKPSIPRVSFDEI